MPRISILLFSHFVPEVQSPTQLTPTADTHAAVTQQLQSSASLDGSASASASALFEPIKSDPSECEFLHVAELCRISLLKMVEGFILILTFYIDSLFAILVINLFLHASFHAELKGIVFIVYIFDLFMSQHTDAGDP